LRLLLRRSSGLVGRIFAILLITVGIEFAVGTLVYERASHSSLQEDEARRLAEHLVISRKLVAERPWRERETMARLLTTDRYEVRWTPNLPSPPPLAPQLGRMRAQILAWEPSLRDSNMRLRLTSPGRHARVTGALQLPDQSWVHFRMEESPGGWALAIGRVGLALVPAIALIIVAGLLIRRTLNPLRHLARATERVGHGEQIELVEAGTVEVRNLVRAFNEMQRRIHRLITDRTETLAAVGHDLRTPIARLQLRADGVKDEALREALLSDTAEMAGMIDSLLAYLGGEKDPEPPVPTDIAVMAATIVDEATDRGARVSYAGPAHLEMKVRPIAVRRAIHNLVENAVNYGGCADVRLSEGPDIVTIAVDDEGPGIAEHQLEEVLRPFSRLDSSRRRNTRGLGLGLAIVARAVEREQGTLTLSNHSAGGFRAEISLPKHAA